MLLLCLARPGCCRGRSVVDCHDVLLASCVCGCGRLIVSFAISTAASCTHSCAKPGLLILFVRACTWCRKCSCKRMHGGLGVCRGLRTCVFLFLALMLIACVSRRCMRCMETPGWKQRRLLLVGPAGERAGPIFHRPLFTPLTAWKQPRYSGAATRPQTQAFRPCRPTSRSSRPHLAGRIAGRSQVALHAVRGPPAAAAAGVRSWQPCLLPGVHAPAQCLPTAPPAAMATRARRLAAHSRHAN